MRKYVSYAIELLVLMALFGAGYASHMISSGAQLEISGFFGNDAGRNWTASNATETVNFTIANDAGSTDSIVSINITLPSGFSLINSTINSSLYGSWYCTNATLTKVRCVNSTAGGLGKGNTMYVWFNATSSTTASEALKTWSINTGDNATGTNGTVLYSWVDGAVTTPALPDALQPYIKTQPTLNWTSSNSSDDVSGIDNYTIYHSDDGANYSINGTTTLKTFTATGLAPNKNHSFIVQTRDRAGNAFNSSAVHTVIDTIAPSVYLNTSDNANFSNTYYPRLYFNATDNYDANMSCELFVGGYPNGTRYIANATSGLSIQTNSSLIGSHQWYVNCTDDAGNIGYSGERTLNVEGVDFVVLQVNFTSPDTNPTNSSSITAFALVKNTGNANPSKNVTVTFYLDGNSIGTKTITNSTLTAGQSKLVNLTYILGLKKYSSSFNHTLRAAASAAGLTELNSSNNDRYNYSLYAGYNVTVTSMDASRKPGENLTVTVMVRYPNGSGVTGLDKRNFTVYDKFSGETSHEWGGSDVQKPPFTGFSRNVYNESFNPVGGGQYTFKIAAYNLTSILDGGTYDTTRPGEHTVQIDVQRNESGKMYTGSRENDYNLTVPMFDIIYKLKDDSEDLGGDVYQDESTTKNYDIWVKNTGTGNLTSVNISFTFESNALESVTGNLCTNAKKSINAGQTVKVCYMAVKTKSVTVDDSSEIDVVASGNYEGKKYTYDGDSIFINVNNVPTTPTPPPSSPASNTGAGAPGATTGYPNCETSDDCFSDEYCNSHKLCKELSCADDEEIVDHKCEKKAVALKDYSLTLSIAEDEVKILHGDSGNVTINVKNDGKNGLKNLSVKLRINNETTDITGRYVVLSNYSKTIENGITETVKIKINTNEFSFGEYVLKALADSDKANASTTFTLKVIPNDNDKIIINKTMKKIGSDYSRLYKELDGLLKKYPNSTNIRNINGSLALVDKYLKEAELAIEVNDYLSAYENQKNAEKLMDEIRTSLENEGLAGNKYQWLINAVVIVILLIGGVIGFQYYRENIYQGPGYHPTKGYKMKKSSLNETIMREIDVLKVMIRGKERAFKPAFNYGSYNKVVMNPVPKSENENILKRLSDAFRNNDKFASQKTLYDMGKEYRKKKGFFI